MLTAIFGFIKAVVVKAAVWAVETVRGFIVDTVMGNVFNN